MSIAGGPFPLFALIVVLAVGAGVALVFVDPLLVLGAILGLIFVFLVMRKPFVGLLAYTAIYVLRPAELYPVLEPLRMERLVGVLTLGSVVLAQISRRGQIEFDASRQTRWMVGLVIAAALSLPFAFWWEKAMEGVVEFLKILVFYILVVHLLDTRAKLRGFLWLLTGLIAYQAALSVFDYFHGQILYAQGIERAIGRTGGIGANELGATMAATIPIYLLFGLDKGMGRWRILHVAIFVLLLLTLVFTGSRSALLGFLASMGFFAWRSRHRVLFGVAGVIFLVGGFSLLPQQYKGRYETITESHLDDSSKLRLIIWKAGVRMVVARPLTGVGVGCYGIANGMEFSPPDHRNWMEAHSLYVQVPAELGLLGALMFFLFLREFFRNNRWLARALDEEGEAWRFEKTLLDALFAGTLALLVTGVFGHSLMRRTWYVYAAMTLAMLRTYVTWARAEGRPIPKGLFR